MTLQVPPHDLEAERVVLASVLLDPESFDRVEAIVSSEHFYSDAHRHVFGAVHGLAAIGKPLDIEAVAGWLKDRERLEQIGGPGALLDLVNATPAVVRVEEYAKRVVDKWQLRRIILEMRTLTAQAYDITDVSDFSDYVESSIYEATKNADQELKTVGMRVAAADFITALRQQQQNGKRSGLSTGFLSLDKRIGRLQNSQVYVAAGRPGMGKTSFAASIMMSVASGTETPNSGVIFFSLEMPRNQIVSRMLSEKAMLDTRFLRSGILSGAQWQKVSQAAESLSKLPLLINDTAGTTVAGMRSAVRRGVRTLQREHGTRLGLIVIDYLQLMRAPELGNRVTANDKITYVMDGIRCAAKDFNVPILLLSQLNREVEKRDNKRPQMSDLRDSGSIEQDANTIMFLYREDKYRKPGEHKSRDAEVIVAKARDGSEGTVRLDFVDYCTKFVDRPDDDPEDLFAQSFDQFDDFGEPGERYQ